MWALEPKGCASGLFASSQCCLDPEELDTRYTESMLLVPWLGLSSVLRWILCVVPSPYMPFENRCSWFALSLPIHLPLLCCEAEARFLHTQRPWSSGRSVLSISPPEGIQAHLFHTWGKLVTTVFRCLHWVQVFQKMWKVLLACL